MVLEKPLESPLDCKEIQSVHPKGNLSWIFIGRTDAEAPVLWPPDGKNWLTGKDSDAGKDWRQEEKGTTEDEMVGWHHRLDVHEFEQAPGVGDGQGSLACCSPWGHKESDMTEQLNWIECIYIESRKMVPKNLCFQIIVLEKTLESPLVCKEIKPVSPKGNQPWIFTGSTDAEAQYFGHLVQRASFSLEKTLMLGKIEGRRRKWSQRMRC